MPCVSQQSRRQDPSLVAARQKKPPDPPLFSMIPPRRTRPENATFVVESINALGLRVPAGLRVMQMHRTLTDESRPLIRPGDPDFETAVEAEGDLQVLAFVFDVAAAHPTDRKFRDLVKLTLGDSVLPQDNRNQSKGRDFQFELFIAAICQNAGLLPVVREEPDVTLRAGREVRSGRETRKVREKPARTHLKGCQPDRKSRHAWHNSVGDLPPLQSQQCPHNQANVRQQLRGVSPSGPLPLYKETCRPNPQMGRRQGRLWPHLSRPAGSPR